MKTTECVKVKIAKPTKRKARWLDQVEQSFGQAVQYCLERAQDMGTKSRKRIHNASYYAIRDKFGLPSDYARMAVNAAISLMSSYYVLKRNGKRPSFPTVRNSQGIGLGVNSYKIIQVGKRCFLRCSTGKRGQYVYLPLCIPAKFQDRIALVGGDAKLIKQDGTWYVVLPVKAEIPAPTVCDGEQQFIGVDLGIAKTATISTPTGTFYFSGEPARHKREYFATIRKRYQRANRMDRVKSRGQKESRWMRNRNHVISKRLVEIASQHEQPVIVFERLDGIRYRVYGSKRFNRMISSWTFRDLIGKIEYKAARAGIPVIFVDPRNTSRTCTRCGHASSSNRKTQALFRCVECGFEHNADVVAAYNIAARGAVKWADEHGASDTPRPFSKGQAGSIGFRLDEVNGFARRFSIVRPQP